MVTRAFAEVRLPRFQFLGLPLTSPVTLDVLHHLSVLQSTDQGYINTYWTELWQGQQVSMCKAPGTVPGTQ